MLELAKADAIEAGEDPGDVTLEPWRLHDARRTMATGFQKLKVRFEVTEAALNHKSGASRSGIVPVYQQHEWEPEKREAFAQWSAYLDELLDPAPEDDKIVPITAAKGAKS